MNDRGVNMQMSWYEFIKSYIYNTLQEWNRRVYSVHEIVRGNLQDSMQFSPVLSEVRRGTIK